MHWFCRIRASRRGEAGLRARVGPECAIQSLTFGEPLKIGDITLSFHPAGHILGSSQVRLEQSGEVWVVSGDYKLAADPACQPFEPLRCHKRPCPAHLPPAGASPAAPNDPRKPARPIASTISTDPIPLAIAPDMHG